MNLELTISSLQDKGLRLTKIRKEIIKLFSEHPFPLSAKKIEEILSKAHISVNKTTVYRELQFLHENGYLLEVYLRPGEISYESSELKHHHHLICDSCGRIDNVTNCLVQRLDEDVLKKKGFRIVRHSLEFYGTCAACLKKFF